MSLDKIKKRSSASKNTIMKSIDRLIESGYISREKCGKCYIYSFSEYKQFEVFSYDFLDKPDLTFNQKAYYAANQPLMIKDKNTKTGKLTYSNSELSDKLHMPIRTIQNYDMMLKAKKYLSIVRTNTKDAAGFFKMEKIFDLEKFGQAIIFILQNHEQRLRELEREKAQEKEDRIVSVSTYDVNKRINEAYKRGVAKGEKNNKSLLKDNNILKRNISEKDAQLAKQQELIRQLQKENLELKTNNKVSLDEGGNKIYQL